MATSQNKTSDVIDSESNESIKVSQGIPRGQDCVSPKAFVLLSGLSLSTVRRYLKDGRLPKVQLGGARCRVLIPRDAVERHFDFTANRGESVGTAPADDVKPSQRLSQPPADCHDADHSAKVGGITRPETGPIPNWMRSPLLNKHKPHQNNPKK